MAAAPTEVDRSKCNVLHDVTYCNTQSSKCKLLYDMACYNLLCDAPQYAEPAGSVDFYSRGLTPTAADPKEKLPSESVRGCSEKVLKASAEPFSGGAWTKVQSQG